MAAFEFIEVYYYGKGRVLIKLYERQNYILSTISVGIQTARSEMSQGLALVMLAIAIAGGR